MIDITKLQFVQSIRAYHHAALWEEEKHFTWLNSLIFSAQLFLLTSSSEKIPVRFPLIVVVSLLGISTSLVALRVIRKESEYFLSALSRFVEEHNLVFQDTNRALPSVPVSANKSYPKLIISFFLGRVGVRDAFQVVFLTFGAAFLAVLLIAITHISWFR